MELTTAHQTNGTNGTNDLCSRDNVLKTTVFPILYSLLFLLGMALNILAAWVFFSIPSRSHFIIYLKNIVVADILTTLTFPFKILSDSNVASIGIRIFVCRVSSVLFYLTMYISILFFGLISLDRCRKTLWPFVGTNSKRLTLRKLLSAAIWASLLLLSLPNVILTSKPPASEDFKCSDLKTPLGLKWHEVVNHICQVIFWGNLLVVVVCYTLITKELYSSFARTRGGPAQGYSAGTSSSQRKKKVRVNVFLVLAVFFICFVPFHFARVPYTMSQTRGRLFDCRQKLIFFQVKESTLWLTSLNSLLDPLIYFFLCKSFRDSLFNILQLSPGRCMVLQDSTDTTAGPVGNPV
ncbi:P2Y purinoceptor 12 [Astyanax mexicanus]|uniref:P2Y purinoceptor 12 n=1 Tax=Astyanax mexicanus TaxID=7994 RepID=A0A8T2M392_ASTMX|nr:P2Y purinoceptor 12 [Astyanax mexicanus]XP_007230697.3 P2Y purinoceptor 12 [Astyanax mexicanus]KAG9278499.1 P2Y purinoceptor 12 [Astyanax mexicanus]